jgi:hypothetical protein
LNSFGQPQPAVPDQAKWTAQVSGQLWGNGIYQVKGSSVYEDKNFEDSAAHWRIFDHDVTCTLLSCPHFAHRHYEAFTGEWIFGSPAGYSLDQQYFGELPHFLIVSHSII